MKRAVSVAESNFVSVVFLVAIAFDVGICCFFEEEFRTVAVAAGNQKWKSC